MNSATLKPAPRAKKSLDKPPAAAELDGIAKLLERYGSGQLQFAGSSNASFERHLIFDHVISAEDADARERFWSFARSVRDVLSQWWVMTEKTYDRENPKRIYYLSIEFLLGRSLANNYTNLLLEPLAGETRSKGT